MEKVDHTSNKPSEIIPMAFPPYRRSHFRSQTYTTLVRILSKLSPSNVPDNGNVGVGQENQEKEPECSELKVGSDVEDPKGPIPLKEIHDVHETIESVTDNAKDLSADAMVLDDAAEFLMGGEEPSTQTDGFHLEQMLMDELELVVKGTEDPEQMLMDELELVVKGTEDPVSDNGLIPLNCEKQNSGSEVDLLDYREEHVEFLHSGTNTSESVSEVQLQVQGELNRLDSGSFHASESTKGQASDSIISSTSSIKNERQQKETEMVTPVCPPAGSLPTIQEGEFEKEEQYGHKVDEATHSSLDHDTNIEALNMIEDGGLLDSTILKDKCETQNGEKSEKFICLKDTTNSSDILIEEDLEEGEISGDFEMDGNTFDVSSADTIVSEPTKLDEIEKPSNSLGNTVSPFNMGISFQGFPTIKDHGNSSVVQQMFGASGKEQSGLVPKKEKKKEVIDASRKRKCAPDSEEKEDENKQMVDASGSKRGPGSQEKKTRKRKKNRKKRAEKNNEHGAKRLKLNPVQKPKPIPNCRHYMKGRCHEGDKCNFSHDAIPLTKSKPCSHFAQHSCMRGDDCAYDHQLSKYPCSIFVSKGSCHRGHACMFSHQVPTSQDIPTPINAGKPELKSPLSSGNTNFRTPLNNYGTGSVQQNKLTNSKGTYSHTNVEHKVTDISQIKPTSTPKGIAFLNVANFSPSTPKQDTVTPNKGNLIHSGTCADKGQNTAESSKKNLSVMPKGVNFLSFGKGSVCSFKRSIQSTAEGMILKLPQSVNFGLSEHSISSLNKDDYGKASDRTAQNLPQTALFSHEISDKNQSMAERMKSRFLGKDATGDSVRDRNHCKSVQEVGKASDNSQTSTVTSATLASSFVSHQSSEGLVSGCHKQASNLGQRALLSTLAFAAEHESDIKMKCHTGASPV